MLLANKIPPPPGFKPPVFNHNNTVVILSPVPVAPSVISVLNPTPASSKPAPNYKLSQSPLTTKSILRNGNAKQVTNRVSFDFDDFPKPKLPPKKSNPSMPNLSTKNPFFMFDDNDDSNDTSTVATVKLGEDFFNSLFTTNAHFTDPWSASKSSSASKNNFGTAAPPAASVLTPMGGSVNATITTASKKSANQIGSEKKMMQSAEDKYAALKDLDEIFKSTVVMSDGKSTGTSIFGSANVDPSPIFGPSPTNNGFQTATANNWGPQPTVDKFESSFGAASGTNRGPSPVASGWATNWPSNSNSTSSGSKAPINPFTGKLPYG